MSKYSGMATCTCALVAVLMMAPVCAAPQLPIAAHTTLASSIARFLQRFDHDKTTRYTVVYYDLNGDGKREAIVALAGPNWCGSGGCNTLVLTPQGASWRIVTVTTLTRPPIRVLATVTHGWHALGVQVQGGGIQPGYEAELDYNGTSYPKNPTVLPAHRLKRPVGKVVIWPGEKGVSLHGNTSVTTR